MVKVIGLTDREKADRERQSRLLEIAKKTFPSAKVMAIEELNYLRVNLTYGVLSVHTLGDNEIRVDQPATLDGAKRLAQAYEKSGEKEFTVKKMYE